MKFGYRFIIFWCLFIIMTISSSAIKLKSSIDNDNFLNEIMIRKRFFSTENNKRRNFDFEAQSPDQYLTDIDKKMINNLISNNLISKLMNIYAISSRSR